ncbi:riboflavin synthase [Synoicihabitans lomoniglobus]|uniref:Riboflavin synthase n=1 Tax=Synoicihabitans lomoniglobus TaxID=2909285 RepID=A0AAF0CS81_9BACT|nr:riboflavin synthase [Opitutaceae bacterium LMO-M01]WED67133.1 riboflavin synthase [Opitutaceae bacterium LMO-M01]
MFTGIIEETGLIKSFEPQAESWRLVVSAARALVDVELGDSIAVNGCCLTVVAFTGNTLSFDVLAESKRLTTLDELGVGGTVNLERAVRFNGKMGGHFVTGHVDGLGRIEVFEPRGKDTYLRVQAPAGMGRYLVQKGSIAIDGISLTVAEVEGDAFAVWLIPHTISATNLSTKREGDAVNLEFDQIGKYVEKLVAPAFR